tara:strand:+ start:532 stop:681 length:150 start_codon:yes stop_codon:yes gene_type:complete
MKDTFELLQDLYDSIEDVISSNKDMELNIQSINKLETIYNKLKEYDENE